NPDILLLDEPTNGLDIQAIHWLEDFLMNFENTVIVVSHDRHFLNKVSTHIADVDYRKIQIYVGNYDFWYESSQLASRMAKEENNEKKILDNVNYIIDKDDKVAFVGKDDLANTTLFEILMGRMEPDEGEVHWGVTTSQAYLPKDNAEFFEGNENNLVDWLRQ